MLRGAVNQDDTDNHNTNNDRNDNHKISSNKSYNALLRA